MVDAETGVFKLVCLIVDRELTPLTSLFTVKVSPNDNVFELKQKVKELYSSKLKDVDPGDLIALKLDQPQPFAGFNKIKETFLKTVRLIYDGDDQGSQGSIEDDSAQRPTARELDPMIDMGNNWVQGCVHVIIQLPAPARALKRHQDEEIEVPSKRSRFQEEQDRNANAAQIAFSPSHVAKHKNFKQHQNGPAQILNGRPCDRVGPPISLYHSVFHEFEERLKADDEVPLKTRLAVRDFIDESSGFYDDESHRMTVIEPTLLALLGQELTVNKLPRVQSDGVLTVSTTADNLVAYIVVLEGKTEIGTGGGDPYLQASLAYQKYTSRVSYRNVRLNSYCPCFLIALAGPWFCVSGAVYLEKPVVQPLTDYLWTGPRALLADQSRLERVFHSLKSGIDTLRTYYSAMPPNAITRGDNWDIFPYILSYSNKPFSYVEKLGGQDRSKLVFKVEQDGVFRVVKFAISYNKEAHELLAAEDNEGERFAPALHYVSEHRFGGRWMVVMDYVDGKSAADSEFTRSHFNQVKKALARLHEQGFVFGDLRRPNIMLTGEHAMLIDFDWCGKAGKAKYPINLNSGADWAAGASAGELIQQDHDLEMLAMLHVGAD